jgi:hypothetical protein
VTYLSRRCSVARVPPSRLVHSRFDHAQAASEPPVAVGATEFA